MRQIPSITSEIRRASPAIVKVMEPMRSALKVLLGDDNDRAVVGSELAALTTRVASVEALQALTFEASDVAADVIGREDTADDTGTNDSSTWETVRRFSLIGSGTIAIRINAWMALVGPATLVQNGEARVLKNSIVVGAAQELSTSSGNEEVWTPLKVVSTDSFEIQLKAGIQDDGGNFDGKSQIAWSEVRALVRYVEWS